MSSAITRGAGPINALTLRGVARQRAICRTTFDHVHRVSGLA